jgi:hypothetical protein
MNKKNLDYVVIGIIALLLIGSISVGISLSSSKDVVVVEDLDLEQYRGEGIPIDCRLPVYESRVESWKDHLSHHEETLYCLGYYE